MQQLRSPNGTLCVSLLCLYVFGAATPKTPDGPTPTTATATTATATESLSRASAQDPKPLLEIMPSGDMLTKPVGSRILLTCKPRVTNTKLISDIQWIDPQNRVIESQKLLVLPLDSTSPGFSKPPMYTELHRDDNSLSLFFNSLTEEQAGKYICKAQYANTQLLTKYVTIEAIVAITWDDAPENQFPILGDDFAIKCQVRARPSPTVDWVYNGEVIKTGEHYVIETHALRIKNVRETDDGIYTCRASVPETGELQERNIRVEVHTKPTIEEFEDPTIPVIEGENANIVCKGAGKPPPKMRWIKTLNMEDLTQSNRFSVNVDTGVLTITNVNREDSGEYQCTATNAAGQANMNIQLNVIVKPKIIEFLNETIAQGQKVTIGCRAFGRPPPKINFRKRATDKTFSIGAQSTDDRIILSNRVDDQKGETLGELIIDRTLRSDDGLYECIATNKGGMAFKDGHLTVEFPPSFASMSNRTIWSWDARPVNLTCIAESIPNATIRWTYYGDRKVEGDPNIRIYGNGPISSLYIVPLDRRHYTQYKCIASNKHGEAYHPIELREAPKPADIPQVNMVETTATTMTFDIQPPVAPEDLPIRTIHVQYRKQDTSWATALNRTWAVGSIYVVEKLDPQTNYEFRFAASNEAGRGNWGMNKMFSTTMKNVPGLVHFLPSPEGTYIASHYHDRYNLKWSAAPDNGEFIDYYEIKWCETKKYTGDQWMLDDKTCQIKTENKQDTWLQGLYPDTFYKIEVRGHNSLGLGQAANITIRTSRGSMSNTSVLQHHGSILSSAAIIGIVIAVLIVIMLITDAILCCANKSGIIYYMCERSRRKPVDEEDAKLGRDEKEPLKEEKKITPIIDSGLRRETSVTFDGKRSISKTGFVGKDSAV